MEDKNCKLTILIFNVFKKIYIVFENGKKNKKPKLI